MKLLLDNHLSPRIARCLEALFEDDHEIVALRDKFSANTTDVEWITKLDEEGGWAVITKDLHIRTRPHERAALDKANIVFFFLAGAWRKSTVEDTAARLIRWIPKIVTQTTLVARAALLHRPRRDRQSGDPRHIIGAGERLGSLALVRSPRRKP